MKLGFKLEIAGSSAGSVVGVDSAQVIFDICNVLTRANIPYDLTMHVPGRSPWYNRDRV